MVMKCGGMQGQSGEVSRQDSMQEIKLADFDTILGGYLGQAGNTARLCLLLGKSDCTALTESQ